VSFPTAANGGSVRNVILASADVELRRRLKHSLLGMRWLVREAAGGAEAMAQLDEQRPEALLMDNWLPDLEASEFARQIGLLYPGVDVLRVDGVSGDAGIRSPRRHELLHALREALEPDSEAVSSADEPPPADEDVFEAAGKRAKVYSIEAHAAELLPEMVGRSAPMVELARLIRLVAPTSASVLIEGETGTGKEVVANAIYRLSNRSERPFAVLNCAAIPETLLEAELFGHTRGAFTGAVQARIGRIESANGGTLFLDEIGEMPLALQAKMLRFLECGELQRIGDNETMRVDVRVIAATHKNLEERAADGTFRLDLYHRLAVFPLEVPALRARMVDLPLLAEHMLKEMGKLAPRKRLTVQALDVLQEYAWPGNVRELAHVLQRGAILAGPSPEIRAEDIRLRRATR
jgi:DNA-binding NtrC family response regulator